MKKISIAVLSTLLFLFGLQAPATAQATKTALMNAGTYTGTRSYAKSDVVLEGSSYYISKSASNQNHDPATSPTYWASLGSSTTPPPAIETKWVAAAVCNGGVAYSSGLSTYDNQQPTLGCISASTSSAAYMAFNATPTVPQYATATFAAPAYWTGSDLSIVFAGTATSGNVAWTVQSGCTNANGDTSTVTYTAGTTVTTNVSTTPSGLVTTATLSNFASPGSNGCVAGTTPGSLVTYRVYRASSDTQAGDAHLLGAILTTHRSQ